MAIPQININLVDNAVTTQGGQHVSVFINYIPASSEEIEGLRTADVRRVEYLDFPTDPRFHGSEHVINFIMQKYEYGGYTKATIGENFLVGKLSSRASIYSKFAYKSMTYDLYAGASNHDIRHSGTSIIGKYTLENADRKPYHVIRNEIVDDSHFKYNQYPLSSSFSVMISISFSPLRSHQFPTRLFPTQPCRNAKLQIIILKCNNLARENLNFLQPSY